MPQESTITVKAFSRHKEMAAVVALHRRVFSRPEPQTPEELMDVARGGGLILGGYVGKELVGFSVALLVVDAKSPYLYGKATGVLRGHRDAGLGQRFKVAQRDYCLSKGLSRMEWVFSPLVARTAHFHLTSIGATSRSYDARFYASTGGRSGPFATNDRLIATWEVASQRVESRLAGKRPALPEGAWITKVEMDEGLPRLKETLLERTEPRLLLEIPEDLYAFRSCPEVLVPWRKGVGQLLEKYVNSEGYVVTECFGPVVEGLRRPFYLLERGSDMGPV